MKNLDTVVGYLSALSAAEVKKLLSEVNQQIDFTKARLANDLKNIEILVHQSALIGAEMFFNQEEAFSRSTAMTKELANKLSFSARQQELKAGAEKDETVQRDFLSRSRAMERTAKDLTENIHYLKNGHEEDHRREKSQGITFIDKNENLIQGSINKVQNLRKVLISYHRTRQALESANLIWHEMMERSEKKLNEFMSQPYDTLYAELDNFLQKRQVS